MAKFRGSARQGEFRPLQVADETQKIQQQAQNKVRGMERAQQELQSQQDYNRGYLQAQGQATIQGLQQNMQLESQAIDEERKAFMRDYETEMRNLEIENKQTIQTMELISSLSGSAMEFAQGYMQQEQKNKQEAYAGAVLQTGITAQEAIAIQKLNLSMSSSDLQNNQVVQGILARNPGMDVGALRRIQKLGGSRRFTESKHIMNNTLMNLSTDMLQLEGKEYQITLPDGTQKVTSYSEAASAAGSPTERSLILQQMKQDWIRSSGIAQMNPQLVGTMVFPKISAWQKKLDQSYTTEERRRIATETKANTYQVFSEEYRQTGNLDRSFTLVESQSGGQRTMARANFLEFLETGVTNGTIPPQAALDFLNNKQITINGQSKSFLDRYGGFKETQDALKAAETAQNVKRTKWRQGLADRKLQAQQSQSQLEVEIRNLATETGQPPSRELIDQAKEQFAEQYPDQADLISEFDDIPTIQSKNVEEARAELTEARDNFTLTERMVLENPALMGEFLQQARIQDQARGSNGADLKTYDKAIAALVRSPDLVQKSVKYNGGQYDTSVFFKEDQLKQDLRRRMGTILQSNPQMSPEAAARQAMQETEADFNAKYKTGVSPNVSETGGYVDLKVPPSTVGANAQQFRGKINSVNQLLTDNQDNIGSVLNSPGTIFTQSDLEAIAKGYGEIGWSPGPLAEYVANVLGDNVTPLDVINAQRAAQTAAGVNMPPLDAPESVQAQQLLSPGYQQILNKFNTSNRSTRAWGSPGEFNSSIIPNGMAPVIEQSSKKTGVLPAQLAALADIESGFDPNIPSYNNSSFGLFQINRSAHPEFFANNDWKDPQASADYGAAYYKQMLEMFGDPVAAAMAYNAGPGNYQRYLEGSLPDGAVKTEMLAHGRKFEKALYKYGDKGRLASTGTMRPTSPIVGLVAPLKSFAPQVSSIMMERDDGQPGMDIFFEDKQFPAVLPGVVKESGYQGNQDAGYGNYIVVESIDPTTGEKVDVLYAHLAEPSGLLEGSQVQPGMIIGTQGGTGSVRSDDGTIASIDFLAPAPKGSKSMTPYSNFRQLRQSIASQLRQ